MSGQGLYVPSEHPLTSQSTGDRVTPQSDDFQGYINDILKYGPLPPNFKVQFDAPTPPSGLVKGSVEGVRTTRLEYVDTSTSKSSIHHPCSPEGRKLQPSIQPELNFDRKEVTAVFHPPLPKYMAGQLAFKSHSNWEAAVAASLNAVGCSTDGKPLTEGNIRWLDNKLSKKAATNPKEALQHTLYHPSDRQTVVFADEPKAARMAKHFNRDLVVLCPLTPKSGLHYDYFWQQTNRPPPVWRYSVGNQGCLKFALIVCLPVYGEGFARAAHWLTVTSMPAFQKTWDSHLTRDRNFQDMKHLFGIANGWDTNKFIWVLVAAHRTCVNGLLPKDTNLGRWIHCYAKYVMAKTQPKGKKIWVDFEFDSEASYKGRSVDVDELGAWILNSSHASKYVKAWELSNDMHLQYLLNRTDENWQKFQQAMELARTIP